MSDSRSDDKPDERSAGRSTDPDDDLQPLLWEDKVFIDSHKTAIEKAIESADAACGTVLTACFSLVTAYGAAIALVAPKDEQAPFLVVSPFVLLALGAVIALVGKAAGITMDTFVTTVDVRQAVKTTVHTKRVASWAAVASAAGGVVLAGIVLFATYGEPDEPAPGDAEIVLTSEGSEQIAQACGDAATSVRGRVSFADAWVTIELSGDALAECNVGDKLTLPSTSVAYTGP
jgi:hypothetical protein